MHVTPENTFLRVHLWRACLMAMPFVCLTANAQLTVRFDQTSVSVTGASPNEKLVFYGVAAEPVGGNTRLIQRRELVRADKGGNASLDLGEPVPFQSFWLVADDHSGRFLVATPPGFSPAAREQLSISPRAAGSSDWLDLARPFTIVCVVRPGRGAWEGVASAGRDGGGGSTARGHSSVSVERLKAIDPAMGPPPTRLSPHDVIFVVDPDWMRYSAVELTEAPHAQ